MSFKHRRVYVDILPRNKAFEADKSHRYWSTMDRYVCAKIVMTAGITMNALTKTRVHVRARP